MARILAISSQVARGHVGLSAIVPALQALGHEVVGLPTILLSNHPGHPHASIERIAPDILTQMLDALDANGWLAEIDAVLTGYLPSEAHVRFAVRTIHRVQEAAPRAVYLCDAVLGDSPKGIYIDYDAAAAIRLELVPLAEIVKGNAFEIDWLSGQAIRSSDDVAVAAARRSWPSVLATSVPVSGTTEIANVLVSGGAVTATRHVPVRQGVPKGTGDLLSALFLGHLLAGATSPLDAAIDDLTAVVDASVGAEELRLVACLRAIARRAQP